ncbi:MAG: SIMPL domain-containing protein [Bacteroidota bacterium]
MKKSALLLFGLVMAFAKTNAQTINSDKAYIEVTGIAEKEIVPDEIFIAITLKEKYVNKEKMSIEAQEEKLKSALKELNIDLNNLYLSDANADYIKVKFNTKDVITKKEYTLKVTTAKEVGSVYQQLEKIEINDAYIAKVNHSKIELFKKETRIDAIKAAKDKANYLLMAIDAQLGKPLAIKEENLPNRGLQQYQANYASNVRSSRSEDFNDGEIQFDKIKIQSSVYAKFEIK